MRKPSQITYKTLPRTHAGEMRTPVTFFEYGPASGPEPGQTRRQRLFHCLATVYNPSMRDLEATRTTETRERLTVLIRDTRGHYLPDVKHFAEVAHSQYAGKVFNILRVEPDIQNGAFTKVILAVVT